MRGNHLITAGRRIGLQTLMALAGCFCAVEALGQEALRISTAGDLAAESQKRAESSIGYYNLLTGPVAWRFSSGLGIDYNDNVRLQSQNAQSDFIFRPNVNTQIHWPVTQVNDLNVSVAAGYSEYLHHQDLSQFYVRPGSGLSLDIYTGDFVINLHDRLSITENAYQNQSVNGNTTVASLQNAAGVNVLWDLNKAVMTMGYDHGNYLPLNSLQGQPDASSENFFLNAGLRPEPEILAGLEAGGGLVNYSQSGGSNSVAAPDATQWNVGAFCTATISDYMEVRLDAGYTMFQPDAVSTNFDSGGSSGFYLQFLLTHQVNRFLSYTLSAGRSVDLQYSGQPYDRYTVRWQPSWSFLRKYSIYTPVWWENGTEIYFQKAAYDQYGAEIDIRRQLTQKLSGGVSDRFVKEISAQPGLDYTDNIISLNFYYQF